MDAHFLNITMTLWIVYLFGQWLLWHSSRPGVWHRARGQQRACRRGIAGKGRPRQGVQGAQHLQCYFQTSCVWTFIKVQRHDIWYLESLGHITTTDLHTGAGVSVVKVRVSLGCCGWSCIETDRGLRWESCALLNVRGCARDRLTHGHSFSSVSCTGDFTVSHCRPCLVQSWHENHSHVQCFCVFWKW